MLLRALEFYFVLYGYFIIQHITFNKLIIKNVIGYQLCIGAEGLLIRGV